MTLLEVITKLVGAVECLVAVDVGALVPRLDVLPHVATVVTSTLEASGATMRATVDLIIVLISTDM